MEPIGAWDELVKQGPLVAFMALVIYFGGKYIKSVLDKSAERETARETRYNQLVDATISQAQSNVETVVRALVGNTAVLERVERKLDEPSNH